MIEREGGGEGVCIDNVLRSGIVVGYPEDWVHAFGTYNTFFMVLSLGPAPIKSLGACPMSTVLDERWS